jgi:uncharacterized phage-like protein YoqJ
MKIAVVGSRDFYCKNFVKEKVDNLCEHLCTMTNPLTIISGGARGVDTWAEEVADTWDGLGVEKKIFKAEWEKFGKRAGYIRNELMIKEATNVIAFWDGKSKGTKHSIDLAIKAGKPIDIYVRP